VAPDILTEVFRGFPQSFNENKAGMLPRLSHYRFLPNPFPTLCRVDIKGWLNNRPK
jgi:hypothetical protein